MRPRARTPLASALVLVSLAAWAGPTPADETAPPVPLLEALGSLTIGVAWQITELDITGPLTDNATVSMNNGIEPTPVLYAQIPVKPLWRDAAGGGEIGYTVRAGYRRFALKRQDLADGDVQDRGTRVSGHAIYAMPFLVGRTQQSNAGLTAGLGLGISQFSASGEILTRRSVSGPPFSTTDRVAVSVSSVSPSLGGFLEFRMGPLVAAMETAIMLNDQGSDHYSLGVSAFSLAWRVDF